MAPPDSQHQQLHPVTGAATNVVARTGELDRSPRSDHHGHIMRTTASIAELKARLSEYVRRVKAGHEVVITERGVPVARLAGLEMAERRATRRDRLVRNGALRPGKGRVRRALQMPPEGEAAGVDVLTALLADRNESR
jgi:prevent-host-death family protein